MINCIVEQNLHTATVTMDDIVCFFSCGSANCLDGWTSDLGKRDHSHDEFGDGGEMERQIEGVFERQINSSVDDFGNIDIHDDGQSSVQGTIPASTQDHTSTDSSVY